MTGDIWVFIEQDSGVIEESSLEVLTRAREVADARGFKVTGLLLGWNVKGLAGGLGRYGAHRVIVVENPILESYLTEPYADVVCGLVEGRSPGYLLAGATRNGRDLLGRLAVRFRTGLQAHVIRIDIAEDGSLVGYVPGFGGNIVAVVRTIYGRPQLATVAIGAYRPKQLWGEAEVEVVEARIDASRLRVRRIGRVKGEAPDISRSRRVIVAGMGTGGDLRLINELAKLLGADVGVTRPIADIGAAPRDIQVGATGVSLDADIVVVVGASGAPHFVSGLRNARMVVAVNSDPEAPMLEHSDYYAVGDLFEIIPRLIERLKR